MPKQEEWIDSAKAALKWFIDEMGHQQWQSRRRSVVDYFNNIKSQQFKTITLSSALWKSGDAPFIPYAFYDDWIAWYMYLVDSLVDRPGCDEPFQSARIYPIFSAIGRQVDIARNISGINNRLTDLFNRRQNQPDSTLFEILVAILYSRNGWDVRFIEEDPAKKTPDMAVTRDGLEYSVECKRLAKVTEYSEKEHQSWLLRWEPLANYLKAYNLSLYIDVTFKVPVHKTKQDSLLMAYMSVRSSPSGHFESEEFSLRFRPINFDKINEHFKKYMVREPSPQFIELLTGRFESDGSYTAAYNPTEVFLYGEDDGLHTINSFIGGLNFAICGKWECIAEESIDKKAKEIRKTLSQAVSQLNSSTPGLIHIGYETLNGPIVEFIRHQKLTDTISNFDYLDKDVSAVFCHAIRPYTEVETFECAETTAYYWRKGVEPMLLLPENLLLNPPGTNAHDGTHWLEDFEQLDTGGTRVVSPLELIEVIEP